MLVCMAVLLAMLGQVADAAAAESPALMLGNGEGLSINSQYVNPNRPQIDAQVETDRFLWQSSMASFVQARSANLYSWALDWSSDQCSVPLPEPTASQPRGYDFRNACYRHDFGYRNYKSQARLTEQNRQRIDDNFQRDMYAVCNTYSGWHAAQGVECRRIADVYHFVVRRCGNQPLSTCAENVRRSLDFLR